MALAALLLAAGCAVPAEPVVEQTPKELRDLRILGTVDGCTVYRFFDMGDFRYFWRCEAPARHHGR
jgi:hypothetical protein